MIQANDLRIGSWILDKSGKPAQIDEIKRHPSCEKDFAYIVSFGALHWGGGYVEDLNPIPLNPEILDKCKVEQLGMNKFIYTPNGWELSCSYDVACLHQLQNLYWAITGNELSVDL